MISDLSEVSPSVLSSAVNSVKTWNRKGILTAVVDPSTMTAQIVVKVSGQVKILPAVFQLLLWVNDPLEAIQFLIERTGIAYTADILNQFAKFESICND